VIVICDASVIIVLAKIGYLRLLRELFGSVLIPQTVYAESVVKDTAETPTIARAVDAGWIRIVPDPDHVQEGPGRGERAALALASELGADLMIVDDLVARRLANVAGIPISGTVGVLERAIDHGLIAGGEALVNALVEAGFRASEELLDRLA